MKLFVWDGRNKTGIRFLESYYNGIAFALANSKEEAMEFLMNFSSTNQWRISRKELESFEPDVYEDPVAFSILGSE